MGKGEDSGIRSWEENEGRVKKVLADRIPEARRPVESGSVFPDREDMISMTNKDLENDNYSWIVINNWFQLLGKIRISINRCN